MDIPRIENHYVTLDFPTVLQSCDAIVVIQHATGAGCLLHSHASRPPLKPWDLSMALVAAARTEVLLLCGLGQGSGLPGVDVREDIQHWTSQVALSAPGTWRSDL